MAFVADKQSMSYRETSDNNQKQITSSHHMQYEINNHQLNASDRGMLSRPLKEDNCV